MATSKTLKPTGVSISIPAFTDGPDQRLNSNCIDKEADAINALSDGKLGFVALGSVSSTTPVSVTTTNNGKYLIVTISASGRSGMWSVTVNSSGTVTPVEFFGASSITVASDGTNTISITSSSSSSANAYIICFAGSASV